MVYTDITTGMELTALLMTTLPAAIVSSIITTQVLVPRLAAQLEWKVGTVTFIDGREWPSPALAEYGLRALNAATVRIVAVAVIAAVAWLVWGEPQSEALLSIATNPSLFHIFDAIVGMLLFFGLRIVPGAIVGIGFGALAHWCIVLLLMFPTRR